MAPELFASISRRLGNERLIERLAAGATNSELASAFGLSPKQAQGFRMGPAGDVAKLRVGLEGKPQPTEETRLESVCRLRAVPEQPALWITRCRLTPIVSLTTVRR